MFMDQHSIFFHALDCKKGGLITSCHNKLCDGVAKLAGKTFTLRHMRNDPEIFRGLAMHGGKAKAKSKETPPQDKEDLKGGYTNPIPMDSEDIQYSRNACR